MTRIVSNGVQFWAGPSRVDSAPILIVATGLTSPSDNEKTGPVVQVSYVPVERPFAAVYDGRDVSVCGSCELRASPESKRRICYVGDWMLSTLEKHLGTYPTESPRALAEVLPRSRSFVRLGAYGDPAVVPPEVNLELVAHVRGHTGYTRRWRELGPCPPESQFLMASVFSRSEAEEAWALGWRTYRVTLPGETPGVNEIECPHHRNPQVQCLDCGLCDGLDGASPKSITNPVHGTVVKVRGFVELRALMDAQ